jgi:hypothetical protein
MGGVQDLDSVRREREAWEESVEAVLMAAGMHIEEARERARSLAHGAWKTTKAEDAAMGELKARGWSTALEGEAPLKLARGKFVVMDNGLE